MRNKSSKLKKLESERYSILTNDLTRCYICKRPKEDMHEIYGAGNRRISMANGFCVPLCRNCHFRITNNYQDSLILKRECQQKFEESYGREQFMYLIGRNYL